MCRKILRRQRRQKLRRRSC